ncbi:MAG: hypothetical protein K2M29_00975 [Paramuribaculum sp.]|nr:hypothetical protein [Paramuribaculum sp.]
MKKLVLVFAVAFSASLFSCGNSEKAAEAVDTAAVVVEEVAVEEVVDSAAAVSDSTAAVADSTVVDE